MSVNLQIRNFRVLRHIDWDLSPGVSVLTGANGSGKTTLLAALELLRHACGRSFASAVQNPYVGGIIGLKNFDAPEDEEITFKVTISPNYWEATLPVHGGMIEGKSAETFRSPAGDIFRRHPLSDRVMFSYDRDDGVTEGQMWPAGVAPIVKSLYTRVNDDRLRPIVETIENIRVYRDYNLFKLRVQGSPMGDNEFLHPSGHNVFSVLSNWWNQRKLRDQLEFVRDGLAEAFPDLFEDFEFVPGGQNVNMKFFRPGTGTGSSEGIPHHLAPDGLLVAMLHLTAVAGAPEGSIVAIDEIEEALHPYAIRRVLENLRAIAEHRDLSIIVTTHSPVVLDEFETNPDRIFVMSLQQSKCPVKLTDLEDREWLDRFSLGRLFADLRFAAPT